MTEKERKFREKYLDEIRDLASYYRRELLTNIVPFWEERVVDKEYGGYLNGFDRYGNLTDDRKPGWFIGRDLYSFSALYNRIERRDSWLEIATAGRRYMDTSAYAGGSHFHQMMSRDGKVISKESSIFTEHFIAKGLCEYITACGGTSDSPDAAFARELIENIFVKTADRNELRREGIPDHLQKHAVNFMNLIVALESFQIFENAYSQKLDECLHNSLYVFANDELKTPFEYIGNDGKPVTTGEGRLVDPGHTLESLWFSMEAGIRGNRPEYIRRASEILDWTISHAYDEEYGGFYQHVDFEKTVPVDERFLTNSYAGTPVAWDDKIWWVQAEALNALAMSSILTSDDRQFEYFLRMHEYTKNCFRDSEAREWFSFLKRDGTVYDTRKGFELKGPYHILRTHMLLTEFFEKYVNNELIIPR